MTLSAQTMHSIVLFSLPSVPTVSDFPKTLDSWPKKCGSANMYTVQWSLGALWQSKIRTSIIPQQYLADKRQERSGKHDVFHCFMLSTKRNSNKFGEDWHFGSKDIAELHLRSAEQNPLEFNNIWPPNRTKIRITLIRKIRAQPPPSLRPNRPKPRARADRKQLAWPSKNNGHQSSDAVRNAEVGQCFKQRDRERERERECGSASMFKF